MLSRRSLEKRIEELEQRAARLPALRCSSLPTADDWTRFLCSWPYQLPFARAELEAGREGDLQGLIAFIGKRLTAPAAWAVRTVLLEAMCAVQAEDRGEYLATAARLRGELRELLTKRYPKWRFMWGAGEFFVSPAMAAHAKIDPLQHCLERLARLTPWEVCCWAAQAVRLASDDLRLWQEWTLGGERERWRRFLVEDTTSFKRSYPQGNPAEAWERMCREHELPEHELALLNESAAEAHEHAAH